MRTRLWSVLLTLATLLGCENGNTQGEGQLRVVASVDAQASAELYVDDKLVAEGTAQDVVTKFFAVSPGEHIVDLSAGKVSLHQTIHIESGVRYTLIPSTNDAGEAVVLEDDVDAQATATPLSAELSVRFVHSAAAKGALDIYLSTPESELEAATPTAAGLSNGEVSAFTKVLKGHYRLRIRSSEGPSKTLYDSGPFELTDTGKVSLVVLEQPAGAPNAGALRVLALTDDGSWPLEAFAPCTNDVPDGDRATARPLNGFAMDGLCAAGDVDFYRFDIARGAHLAELLLKTGGIGSALTQGKLALWDAQGQPISEVVQAGGADAPLRILLFPGETYYASVSNAAGRGGAGYTYELRLNRSAMAPVTEATGGTFNGASNASTIEPFTGNFVAISVRDEADAAVDYLVLVRVTLPTAARTQLVYDPASITDGVLRVVLYDGTTPLPRGREGDPITLSNQGLVSLGFPGWSVARAFADARSVPFAATSGALTVQFPSRSVRRQIDGKNVLSVPTVETATLNEARDLVTLSFAQPARARSYEVSAFGRDSAFNGVSVGSTAPQDVMLDGSLADGEAYVVRTRVSDGGLLSLPLPNQTVNVSEFLFYSDAQ